MVLSMVAKISAELADGTCEVAFKARYIGRRDSGIPVNSAFSSLSNSCSVLVLAVITRRRWCFSYLLELGCWQGVWLCC